MTAKTDERARPKLEKIYFVIREACKRESRYNLLDHLFALLHS